MFFNDLHMWPDLLNFMGSCLDLRICSVWLEFKSQLVTDLHIPDLCPLLSPNVAQTSGVLHI